MTPNLKIETWPLARLIPYARNARLHSEAQVAQIAASIAEFGFNNPVLVGPQGGIIAGHARVLAARKPGYAEVPAIVLGHLTENQKRAFILADNKLALNALISCENPGRKARLIEIDPRHADASVRRWQSYTGSPALLEGDGRAFEEMAAERRATVPGEKAR